MPLPIATRIVHIWVVDPPTGTASTGTVRWRLRYALHDSTDHQVLGPGDWTATLGTTDDRPVKVPALAAGEAYIALPVNDESGVTPTGWAWKVEARTSSWTENGYAVVPGGVGTLEFSDIFPSATPTTVNTYATVGALAAHEADTTDIHGIPDTAKLRLAGPIVWPSGLVAFWDFQGSGTDWLRSKDGHGFALTEASGTATVSATSGPFGLGRDFGDGDVLAIAAGLVGPLNVARAGDQVTVGAWVLRSDLAAARCIAGIWKEDTARSYALFMDLPTYGGNNSVCGHVSRTGGPSPSIPFSRDYSASARRIDAGLLHFVAMTYDGTQAKSYIDGVTDSYPTFTEPGAPNGQGLTLVKNPYAFDLGLNHIGQSAFTVGAQELVSGGYGSSFHGTLFGLFVATRAYTATEIMSIHTQALNHGDVLATFDFFGEPEFDTSMYSSKFGWKSALGATATDTSSNEPARNWRYKSPSLTNYFINRSFLTAANTTNVGFGYFDSFSGLQFSQLDTVKFTLNNSLAADVVRFCVRIASTWYATDTTYSVTGNGRVETDWSTAETKTLDIERTAASWRDLTFTAGSALSLAGSARGSDLPNGEVTGVGFYTPAIAGEVRIKNLQLLV